MVSCKAVIVQAPQDKPMGKWLFQNLVDAQAAGNFLTFSKPDSLLNMDR